MAEGHIYLFIFSLVCIQLSAHLLAHQQADDILSAHTHTYTYLLIFIFLFTYLSVYLSVHQHTDDIVPMSTHTQIHKCISPNVCPAREQERKTTTDKQTGRQKNRQNGRTDRWATQQTPVILPQQLLLL